MARDHPSSENNPPLRFGCMALPPPPDGPGLPKAFALKNQDNQRQPSFSGETEPAAHNSISLIISGAVDAADAEHCGASLRAHLCLIPPGTAEHPLTFLPPHLGSRQ